MKKLEEYKGYDLYQNDKKEICVSVCKYGGTPYINMYTSNINEVKKCIDDTIKEIENV